LIDREDRWDELGVVNTVADPDDVTASASRERQVAIDGLDVWLHRECEAAYLASLVHDSADDAPLQSSPAEPPARTNGIEMPAELSEQQRQDAKRYFARWGDHARACGWTAAQQDRLVRQIDGREVKQLTDTQALVGNKVFYRSQLGM